MSIESAKLFLARMKTDEVFAKKFDECRDPYTRRAFEENEGYSFSIDEFKKVGGMVSSSPSCWSGDAERLMGARRSRKY
jgi:predicted ribosomally synthesized peptide with nif11-like leader